MNRRTMQRVTTSNPCPVCGKGDWCLRTPDNSAAICARIKSGKPVGKREHAGWLHVLSAPARFEPRPFLRTVNIAVYPQGNIDWTTLAEAYRNSLSVEKLAVFAAELGLTVGSLHQLCVGWSAEHRAWAFPMRMADGTIVGIRLRRPSGFKFAVTGSRSALFIPSELLAQNVKTLCIAEGPTDTAALLDLGFVAVGRPSCSGGVRLLANLVKTMRPTELIVVADQDEPGQLGAAQLTDILAAYAPITRIVTPPAKDAREWRRRGATHDDVLDAIAATPSHKLNITIRQHGGHVWATPTH